MKKNGSGGAQSSFRGVQLFRVTNNSNTGNVVVEVDGAKWRGLDGNKGRRVLSLSKEGQASQKKLKLKPALGQGLSWIFLPLHFKALALSGLGRWTQQKIVHMSISGQQHE